jgi:hypothetical protein
MDMSHTRMSSKTHLASKMINKMRSSQGLAVETPNAPVTKTTLLKASVNEQDRQRAYNVIMRRVRVTTVAVKKLEV